jgi:predicted transcriptional regulator
MVQFYIRVRPETVEALREIADKNQRTPKEQASWILERAVARQAKRDKPARDD